MENWSEINSQETISKAADKNNLKYYYFHWFYQLFCIMILKLLVDFNINVYNWIIQINIGLLVKILFVIIWIPLLKSKVNILFDYLIYITITGLISWIFNYCFIVDKYDYFSYCFYLLFLNCLVLCLKLKFSYDVLNIKQFIIIVLLNNLSVFYITLIFNEIEFFNRFIIFCLIIFFIFSTNIDLIDIKLNKENYIFNSWKIWFLSLIMIFKLAEKLTKMLI